MTPKLQVNCLNVGTTRMFDGFMGLLFVANSTETMQPSHISLWLRSPHQHTEEPRRLEKPNTVEEGF